MERYVFYNLQVSRDIGQVHTEIRKLITTQEPQILGLSECMGYDLAGFPGYKLVRDTSRPSRANIAVYVRWDQPFKATWYDMNQTWGRTEHPGEHEPRSWVEIVQDGEQVLVGHQPPQGTDNVLRSQLEGVRFLIKRMAPWTRKSWNDRSQKEKLAAKARVRIVLADFNRRPGEEGPGPDMVASQIWGHVKGSTIDCAVVRNMNAKTKYIQQVGGVDLKSDHNEALIITRGN